MKLPKAIKLLFLIFILICVGLTLAIYKVNQPHIYNGEHTPSKDHTLSIILIDGWSQKSMQQALKNGLMPNIQNLIDQGVYIENGIGSFPSMTGYAYYPFLTGRPATDSGILGLRWFDRSLDKGNLRNYVGRTNVWLNQDIVDNIPTFFEQCEDDYTCSINSFMNRGVADGSVTGWALTTAKFRDRSFVNIIQNIPIAGEELTIDYYQHESNIVRQGQQQLERNPRVQWLTLPSPDASMHVDGYTDQYDDLLIHIDSLVGAFQQTIDSLGQSKSRMLALLTDHGVAEVKKNIDIPGNLLRRFGISLYRGNSLNYTSMLLDQPLEDIVYHDGHFVINGNLAALIYLKNPNLEGKKAWRNNLDYDLLTSYPTEQGEVNIPKSIANIEGIEMVMYKKDEHTVLLENLNGTAEISFTDSTYRYFADTSDPLKYIQYGLGDTILIKDKWIAATIDKEYPDAVYRIAQFMQMKDIGDMVVTTHEGYDLAPDYEVVVGNYKGGHGGIHGDQLRVPYVLYNGGQDIEKIDYMRSEDLGKYFEQWLFSN